MLTLRSMFLRYYRIYVVCLDLELLGSWVVGGFGVGMGAFGWTLNSLMFCVVRSFMVFSGLGLKSPASEFQFYSTKSQDFSNYAALVIKLLG